ncbi:MAG: hypothetical protein IKU11_02895, partial [Clostridia bacterium]|nr:hypothetical protein [Clostridia bacterium]
VLVDGKLGERTIWDSTLISLPSMTYQNYINTSSGVFTSYNGSYMESLRPKQETGGEVDESYANAGEYPAVLKVTAETAKVNGSVGETLGEVEEPVHDPESWILPKADDFVLTRDDSTGTLTVTTQNQLKDVQKAKEDITLYVNGVACSQGKLWVFPNVTANTGHYRVTIDYNGSGTYTKGNVNALAVKGLYLGNFEVGPTATKISLKGSISSASYAKNDKKLTVTLNVEGSVSNVHYGYAKSPIQTTNDLVNLSNGKWQTNNSFTFSNVKAGDVFYFYCYRPGNSEGAIVEATDITFIGTVVPFVPVEKPEDGKSYTIYGEGSNETNYELRSSVDVLLSTPKAFIVKNNVLSDNVDFQEWSVRKVKVNNTDYWQIYKDITTDETDESKKEYVYLKVNRTESGKKEDNSGKPYIDYTYSIVLQSGNKSYQAKDSLFSITSNNRLSLTYSAAEKYWEWEGFLWWGDYVERTRTYSGYLSIKNNGLSFPSNSSDGSVIRFFDAPEVKDASKIPAPSYEPTYIDMVYDGKYSMADLAKALPKEEGQRVETLYVNGIAVDSSSTTPLPTGDYELYATVKTDSNHNSWKGIPLGMLTINPVPFTLDNTLTVDVTQPHQATLTYSGWFDKASDKVYYGYKGTEDTTFHWGTEAIIADLPAGDYTFAVYQSGTTNAVYSGISGVANSADTYPTCTGTVIYPYIELIPATDSLKFKYAVDEDDGVITWYQLPDVTLANGTSAILAPSRVTLLYSTDGINWSTTYSETVTHYAVVVKNSNYEAPANPFVLQVLPTEIESLNGHTTSILRGSSLYFMGDTYSEGGTKYSIRTYGNKVVLNTDLLVLRHGIATQANDKGIQKGKVVVHPYNMDYTILFVVNAFGPFQEKTFYHIPAGTNLVKVTSAMADEWNMGSIGADGQVPSKVKNLFLNGSFPTMNPDIAYASNEQLARIVSGEATGWTVDGVLVSANDTSSSTLNEMYVVCPYVKSMSGSVRRQANRILLAAAKSGSNYVLNVTSNLTVVTRYFSLTANVVNQGSSGIKFTLKNIAQSSGWETLFTNAYSSKTMQMDYELATSIKPSGSQPIVMPSSICRYPDGTELFKECKSAATDGLMVEYLLSDLNSNLSTWFSDTKIVERYMTFRGTSGNTSLEIRNIAAGTFNIYTNYLSFDGVKSISASNLHGVDITINSQESGYVAKEYLGLFTNSSADSYHGTLIYIGDTKGVNPGTSSVNFKRWTLTGIWGGNVDEDVPYGFYFIPAETGSISLFDFANNYSSYKVTDDELSKLAVYVKPDGSMSNAFVDTDLVGGNAQGGTGFAGGDVQ